MAKSKDCDPHDINGKGLIKVVIGIILNAKQEILIARRPDHAELGGYWEFPGGKIEAGETQLVALQRELKEEVGIHIADACYLFTISHAYCNHNIQLIVWKIGRFTGQAVGCEQQVVRWVRVGQLVDY